ncbi:MAG: pyrroline-5-carboxylate reductase family protein [Solirubrobacterales bacterium]
MRIGFAGSGNMAAGMARGWAAARGERGAPETMLFTDAGSGRAQELAEELGGEAVGSNAELAKRADLVVLAVKPKHLAEVGAEVAPAGKPVISMLGAISLDALAEALPGVELARTMPNLGVELRQGVICVALPEAADQGFRAQAMELLGLLGSVIEVSDVLMDPATAVMGCAPGYLAQVAEYLVEAGVREGLASDTAGHMVARAMAATGALLDEHDPGELRDRIASPGGSTEAGLQALERASLKAAIDDAVDASLERMRG